MRTTAEQDSAFMRGLMENMANDRLRELSHNWGSPDEFVIGVRPRNLVGEPKAKKRKRK